MLRVAETIQNNLSPGFIRVLNESKDNLCFIRTVLPPDETKVEIIQNLKNISPSESVQGVRLIHDDDIGALKLLSAAGRGVIYSYLRWFFSKPGLHFKLFDVLSFVFIFDTDLYFP